MKARVARVEEEEKRRVAKEKDEKRPQEGRMRKLAKELGLTPPPVELTPLVGVTPPTPTGVARPTSSKRTTTPHTRAAQQKETERVLLYAIWQRGRIQPLIYTVYINKPFKGLTSSRELATEGLKRWPAFVNLQDLRVERGHQPLVQPCLLGKNNNTFYMTNQANLTPLATVLYA